MGPVVLSNMNQNPTPDVRELATRWSMPPAQAFLRQQALMLYRQKVIQDRGGVQQQQQMQGGSGQPGQSMTARSMSASTGVGGSSLLRSAEKYEAQQADAKQRATTGAEVVPVSQNLVQPSYPQNSMGGNNIGNPSPQVQAEQLRRSAALAQSEQIARSQQQQARAQV